MRDALKLAAHGVATIVVTPSLVSFAIKAPLIGRDRALQGSTQALSLVPGLLGQYLRRAFLARALTHCARSAVVEFGVVFSDARARLDEHAYVGPHCSLGYVHLEADALLGPRVVIPSGAHTHGTADVDAVIRDQPTAKSCVRIGRGAWIGSGAIVMADVGENTVVGAGSVVVSPIHSNAVAVGAPARVVRSR